MTAPASSPRQRFTREVRRAEDDLDLARVALLIAQVPAVRRLEGALQLGLIALNLFFVVIGCCYRHGL